MFSIRVGIKNTGYETFESEVYPQFDGRMMFIMCSNGDHVALPYREIDGVFTTVIVDKSDEG